jgi:hypothetical protein
MSGASVSTVLIAAEHDAQVLASDHCAGKHGFLHCKQRSMQPRWFWRLYPHQGKFQLERMWTCPPSFHNRQLSCNRRQRRFSTSWWTPTNEESDKSIWRHTCGAPLPYRAPQPMNSRYFVGTAGFSALSTCNVQPAFLNIVKRFCWNICYSCWLDVANGHISISCPARLQKALHDIYFMHLNVQ